MWEPEVIIIGVAVVAIAFLCIVSKTARTITIGVAAVVAVGVGLLSATNALADQPYKYAWVGQPTCRVCYVENIEDNVVTFVDSVGLTWLWDQTDEDEAWDKGETASLLIDDMGTESIYDDAIVCPYYSGLKVERR